jgi:PBP1b-binding outer membrane lipoprotein LpoB
MKIVSGFLFSALLLSGCDGKPVVERRFGKKEKSQQDTSVLQAADLTGYDGTKLRKSAGGLINANERHNQAIENALDSRE